MQATNLYEALLDTDFQRYAPGFSTSNTSRSCSPYERTVIVKPSHLQRSDFIERAIDEFAPYLKKRPIPTGWRRPSSVTPREVIGMSKTDTVYFCRLNFIWPALHPIHVCRPDLGRGLIRDITDVAREPVIPDTLFNLTPEIVKNLKLKPFATGEYKRPLVMDYIFLKFESCIDSGEFEYSDEEIRSSPHLSLLTQVWTQMVRNGVVYGFLCDPQQVWFFKKVDDKLEVSSCYKASHQPLLLYFTVFMLLGLRVSIEIEDELLENAFGLTTLGKSTPS